MIALLPLFLSPLLGAAPFDAHFQKSCTTAECHPMPESTGGNISHYPFLEEWCDRCHSDHSKQGENLLISSQPALCLACHTEVETRESHLLHPGGTADCTTCHDPHQSAVRHLLKSDELRLDCTKCHGEQLARERAKPYHHQFFDPQKECGSCHFAHSNSQKGYLRPNVGETCLTCHDMPLQVQGRKLENVGQLLQQAPHLHEPAKTGECHACHTPHGSLQPSLLKDSYPAGNYEQYQRENYGLCWQCHDPATVESATTLTATRFRNGSQNLHQVHVVKFGKGRACHLCHTPHASHQPQLMRDSIRFGSWLGDLKYEPTPAGGSCATACHRTKEYQR